MRVYECFPNLLVYIFNELRHIELVQIMLSVSLINLADFRYKLYLENEDDEVGAVMETGSVEENEEEDNVHHGKENQRPNNQIGRLAPFCFRFQF